MSCSADRQVLGKITRDGVFLEQLETDPARYLPLLQKVSFKGVTGNIAFDAFGDSREGGVTLYQFKAGAWEARH